MLKKPMVIYVDSCSLCQLKCPRCPATTMGYVSRVGSGYLTLLNFRRLLDSAPRVNHIEFDNIGEMFLNPEIVPILGYAHLKKIKISCSVGVNLNYATEEMLEALVKNNFYSLTCSVDGATQETYAQYRVGGNFDTVIRNIKLINQFKDKFSSEFPRLTWQFIVFGHNEHELPKARKMAQDLNMEFSPKMSWDSNYSPIRNREFVLAQTGWPAVTREEYEVNTGKSYVRGTCYSLWHNPRINWDGRVLGCCWNVWS
ncbi:MAG: radical SAM protein, partial [Candidatus Omnitrophica bacterium]|nr:radical SAM protein [Candidatus Omnitrophota bacterium]